VLRTVAVCLASLSLRLDGAYTCGLEVVSGVMAARSRRSSGSRGTLQLGWWYSTGLHVLLDVPTGNTAIDRTLRVQYTPTSCPN